MKTNLDLLLFEIGNANKRAYFLAQEVREQARSLGELQALAFAVQEDAAHRAGSDTAKPITEKNCDNRYSHYPHLWRDEDVERRTVYRCSGRSTDAT